jgi:RNA polymerase sigma-70 factor (ECF subfamily)
MSQRTPPSTQQSERLLDDDVLKLLRVRDSKFLETLFLEINPYLSRICLANRIDSDKVADLLHRTWETFFSNFEKFEARSQIRTFICGILFNKIREHRRDQKRYVLEEDSQTFMDNAFTADGWWKVEPANPYKLFESRQTAAHIKECLEGLTEQQMQAFVMKEVDEDDSQNICNALEISVSYLRVLLFRAKGKLRACLEGRAC